MYQKDGSHWFNIHMSIQRGMSMVFRFFYVDPLTGNDIQVHKITCKAFQVKTCVQVSEDFNDPPVPVIPHSWYHFCLGLDTVSGLLRFVVNGIEVVNVEKKYFKDSKAWKPQSVVGKIAGERSCYNAIVMQK